VILISKTSTISCQGAVSIVAIRSSTKSKYEDSSHPTQTALHAAHHGSPHEVAIAGMPQDAVFQSQLPFSCQLPHASSPPCRSSWEPSQSCDCPNAAECGFSIATSVHLRTTLHRLHSVPLSLEALTKLRFTECRRMRFFNRNFPKRSLR
jgi:hypothetical protein